MIQLIPFTNTHWLQLWPILQDVFRDGTTYAIEHNIDIDTAFNYWVSQAQVVWVACAEGDVLGSYSLRKNDQAAHKQISHCSFIVASTARGQGVGTALAQHSLAQAKQLGYVGMQFNAVAATNTGAVQLWQKLGFAIIETRHNQFPHPKLGMVDAYVMAQTWG